MSGENYTVLLKSRIEVRQQIFRIGCHKGRN